MYKLDLHVHSARSFDGCISVEDLAALAAARGLQGIAVCDHDRVLTQVPQTGDIHVIPGVEVSTQHGHLLGLFVREPIETKDFFAAAEAIHAQGGITVLAHPFERGREVPAQIVPYLDAVEVWNGRAERKNRRANAQAAEFAEKNGLPGTAGSDAHLPEEIGNGVVTVPLAPVDAQRLLEGLRQGKTEGVRARATATAKSQFVKRVREQAPLRAYLKWTLFAMKCYMQDKLGG